MTGSTRTPSRTRHKSPESSVHRKVHAEFGGRLPRKRPVAGTSPGSPPYDSFDGISHQLCCQHLLRDLEDAAQSYPDAIWPGQIADALRALIHQANLARSQGLDAVPGDAAAGHLKLFRRGVAVGLSEVRRVPRGKQPPALTLLECLRHREADVLRFLTDTAIPPTSNQAERDLRPAKTQQKISGRLRLGENHPRPVCHPRLRIHRRQARHRRLHRHPRRARRKSLDTADPGQHLSHARNSSRTATQE